MQHSTYEYRQKQRFKAAALFAEGKHSHSEIGKMLGVSKQCICTWYQAWKRDGEAGLLMKKPGPKTGLSDNEWQIIQDALLEGPRAQGYDTEFWTLERIAELIEKITGRSYHQGYVWHLLTRLGWSHQKPERVAKQRNEDEIAHWVRETWPDIKKGHKNPEPD